MTSKPISKRFILWGILMITASGIALYAYLVTVTTTPSHVFQLTETIVRELESFQQAAQVTSSPVVDVPAGAKPRHVLQKAREVYLRLQALRRLKGLNNEGDPLLTVRVVTPENVLQLVSQIRAGTEELKAVYPDSPDPKEVVFERGKTPGDVYANLAIIGNMLESLGSPPLNQNDVYRIVATLTDDLETIRITGGKRCDKAEPDVAIDENRTVTDADVYALATELQSVVNLIREKNGADAMPEIPAPHPGPEDPSPAEVLDLLNILLADVGKLKADLGIARPTVLTLEVSGKTTADVYHAVSEALLTGKCILR